MYTTAISSDILSVTGSVSIRLCVYIYFTMFIFFFSLYVCLHVRLPVCLFICLYACLPVRLSLCLPTCTCFLYLALLYLALLALLYLALSRPLLVYINFLPSSMFHCEVDNIRQLLYQSHPPPSSYRMMSSKRTVTASTEANSLMTVTLRMTPTSNRP